MTYAQAQPEMPTPEAIARVLWPDVFKDDADRDHAERVVGGLPNAKRRLYCIERAKTVLALFNNSEDLTR